jgi:L-2,4-diaminobutyrate decarboxylase
MDAALEDVRRLILPGVLAVTRPDYVAHFHSPPIIPSVTAELVIAATNQSLDSFDQGPSATALECALVESLCSVFGLPPQASGVFTSGATQSNLTALLLARDAYGRRHHDWDVQRSGLPEGAQHWRILCSDLTHFSVRRAPGILGLGEDSVIPLPTDSDGLLRTITIENAIRQELLDGHRVLALVLTAGTTDLGSIEPIAAGATIAKTHGIWLHIDAAAGGAFIFSSENASLLEGIGGADSIAFDFHKLLFQSISCGVLLVGDRNVFSTRRVPIPYLDPAESDDDMPNLVSRSPLQTTRRFDALKAFLTMRALGRKRLATLIDHTCRLAREASEAVAASSRFALVAPTATNIVLLRWEPRGMAGDHALVDRVNAAIPKALWRGGGPAIGKTIFAGRPCLKLTFMNPLSQGSSIADVLRAIDLVGGHLATHCGHPGLTNDQ